MELALLVYVISMFDSLRASLALVLLIVIVLCVYSFINHMERYPSPKWLKSVIIMCIAYMMVVGVFVPTQKTAWMMVGAYTAQRVAESPAMQETSGKVVTLINQKLDSLIEETVSKKK